MRKTLFFTLLATAALSVIISYAYAKDNIPKREKIVVMPGDSLWSIAVKHRPGQDPRKVVYEIQRMNHVSVSLQVGQELILP